MVHRNIPVEFDAVEKSIKHLLMGMPNLYGHEPLHIDTYGPLPLLAAQVLPNFAEGGVIVGPPRMTAFSRSAETGLDC